MTDRKDEVRILEINLDEELAFLKTLSVIEMLLNHGHAVDREDIHSHKCPDKACGRVWTHDRNAIPPGENAYDKHHTCPSCGKGKQRQRLPAAGPVDS